MTVPYRFFYLLVAAALAPALAAAAPDITTSRTMNAALTALLEGVPSISVPGLPGSLSVFGARAFPVVVGRSGGALEPVVAAAEAGTGRVVVFGHDGYLGAEQLALPGSSRLMLNSIRWTAARKGPVVVQGEPELLAWLRKQGVDAAEGDVGRLAGASAMVISAHDIKDADIEPLTRFVEAGGGLVTAATGWGWEQIHNGAPIATDFPANQLLSRWGLVFALGTLERTGPNGFLTEPRPGPLTHAGRALEVAESALAGQTLTPTDAAQVEVSVTRAALAIPPDETTFMPKLRSLTRGSTGDVVPFHRRPVTKGDLAARLLLTLQVNVLKNLPADQVKAHPAGAIFPGDVPSDFKPVTHSVDIDTKTPEWHSLGLYAVPGGILTIKTPADAVGKGLGVRIGCHTDTLWGSDRWTRVPDITRQFPLNAAETKAANAFGGLVYITVPQGSTLGMVSITISGAYEAPLFVRGKTSLEEWRGSIRSRPAPWAELASDKLILTVPSRVVRTLDDPEALMAYWDAGMDAVADLAGIPHQRLRPERIVADEQISVGYMHSGYPIMTFLDVVDMDVDLPRLLKGVWGQWHEIGHNHQQGDWTFEGTGEVSNNLFPLYVNEVVAHVSPGQAHPAMQPEAQRKRLEKYLAGGADFNQWKSDPFLALTMYEELQQAFGWDAYKKVFAEYRTLGPGQHPKNDNEKRDQWMVRFSRVVGRNLGPFFVAWGVPTSAQARASIAALPTWMPADWPGQKP